MILESQCPETWLGADVFENLTPQPEDSLLGLINLFRTDNRIEKIDLGVGVYKNNKGNTPVMRAVKAAEAVLLTEQDSKSYLGADGDRLFVDMLAEIVFGTEISRRHRLVGVQTPGGTGALRLGAELLKAAHPRASVWIGTPTWPNHASIFAATGLSVRSHRFYDPATGTIDFRAMCADLSDASPGDVLLLHGCCHNPTGAAFTADQWRAITQLCRSKSLIPFIDLAYQGLGDGLEADAVATRHLFADISSVLVAYSCDKNFGLYRDRVGALWIQASTVTQADIIYGNILTRARALWSMPPDHGAAVVRLILQDDELRTAWFSELEEMRGRINGMRELLAAAHPKLHMIGQQRGMFAMLPISPKQVADLRDSHGIYMAANGRINIAGLTVENMPRLITCLAPLL